MKDTNLSVPLARSTDPKPDLKTPLAEFYFRTRSFSNDTSLLTGSFSCGIVLWVIQAPKRHEFSIIFTRDFYSKDIFDRDIWCYSWYALRFSDHTAKLAGIGALKQKRNAGSAIGMPTDHLECPSFGHVERGVEAPSHADQRGRTWQRAALSRLAQGS